MVIKIHEIDPKRRGRLGRGRIYGEGKFLSLEWNRDGAMHSERGGDDDKLVTNRAVLTGGQGGLTPPREVADPPESSAEPLWGVNSNPPKTPPPIPFSC